MVIAPSNPIRFYPTTNAWLPNPSKREDLPFQKDYLPSQANEKCYHQPVDFDDVSTLQIQAATLPTVTVHNAAGTQIGVVVMNLDSTQNGENIYNAVIEWNVDFPTIAKGCFLRATDGTHYAQSERLYKPSTPLLKLTYSNNNQHDLFGNYQKCFEHVLYLPAELIEVSFPTEKVGYESSNGRFLEQLTAWQETVLLQSEHVPVFLSRILMYAIHSKNLHIEERVNGYFVGEYYKVFDKGMEIGHQDRYVLHSLYVTLRKVDGFVQKLYVQDDVALAQVQVDLLPETNITATSFTANWSIAGGADEFDYQLSTTADFSVLVVNTTLNGNVTAYSNTGLTQCERYYYRVRARSCGETTDWVSNENFKQQSIHFQGLFNQTQKGFTERIQNFSVKNVFNWCSGFTLKFAPLPNDAIGGSDWDIYPTLSEAQIQQEIDILTDFEVSEGFTIYFECTGYSQIHQHSTLLMEYDTPSFYITVGCTYYNFPQFSQFVLIAMSGESKYNLDAVQSQNSPISLYTYSLITSSADIPIRANLTSSQLNDAINAHTGDCIVLVNARYQGTNEQDNTIFSISYQN